MNKTTIEYIKHKYRDIIAADGRKSGNYMDAPPSMAAQIRATNICKTYLKNYYPNWSGSVIINHLHAAGCSFSNYSDRI